MTTPNDDAGNGNGGNEPEPFRDLVEQAQAGARFAGNQDEVSFWDGVYGASVLLEEDDVAQHLTFLRESGTYGERVAAGIEKHIEAEQAEVRAEHDALVQSEEAAIAEEAAQKLAEKRAEVLRAKRLEEATAAIVAKEEADRAAAAGTAPSPPSEDRVAAAEGLVGEALETIEAQPGSREAYVAAKKATDALEDAQGNSPVGVNVEEFLNRINRELEERS